MARSKLALKDFLARNCRIKPSPVSAAEEEYYVLGTVHGRLFMTQSHVREVLRAIGQPADAAVAPGIGITVHTPIGSDAGIEHIRVPVKLVENLNEKQAFLILRCFEGILKDVEEGKMFKERLESLFQDTADIQIATGEDGDRIFIISGKLSGSDQRRYVERYAEQVASKTLFDVAKALNAKLNLYIPEESRERFFVEGRDMSDKKIRYGEDVSTELVLTDEGAWIYTSLANKTPTLREIIAKLFQQSMLDPFGLALTHYMGKHNVLKAGKRPLVKIPPISGFFGWVKGLFGKKAA